ncbi:MAG: outer membrane protein assembly factor BamD [Limisphaerales bacterium]
MLRIALVLGALTMLPNNSPAPLIYRPGEGWIYVRAGKEGSLDDLATRAKDQLDIVQTAFKEGKYDKARAGARRLVKRWPLSDFAPAAQYYVARCYEEDEKLEKAFKEYQKLLEKYPKIDNYQEVLKRQYDIATKYLEGKKFKIFGLFPIYRSMEKTVAMYEKVINNGPYSEVAPQAQLKIGQANEKKKDYQDAIRAYEKAADRYHDRKDLAADALYKAAETYYSQARQAEYDQGVAKRALETYHDFISLYPEDERVDDARKKMENLRSEQARGAMTVAKYYEKRKQWSGALIYYNEVLAKAPNSVYAEEARTKITALKERQGAKQ